jgi:hypothetical protein
MSRSRSQKGTPKKPIGTKFRGGGFTIDSNALQRMGPEGLNSLLQFMSNADPDVSPSPPPNTESKEE